MRKWLKSVRNEHVAFTGRAWLARAELQRIVRRLGGIPTAGAVVTGATTILVRGDSSTWTFGEYGAKELKAARLIRKGISISLVHDSEFQQLVESGRPARVTDRIAGDPVRWLEPATKRQFNRAAWQEGPLDREHSVLGRMEQSYLRHTLFGEAEQAHCLLCGRLLPVGLLIAAHIKPRSECSRRERLDVENIVFSLCLLGCDALYERGLVSVADGGRILVSTAQSSSAIKSILSGFGRRRCDAWNEARAEYFRWHQVRRFQGAKAANK